MLPARPSDEFAGELADKILMVDPESVVRLGKMSTVLPMMKKWLPTRLLDRILEKVRISMTPFFKLYWIIIG